MQCLNALGIHFLCDRVREALIFLPESHELVARHHDPVIGHSSRALSGSL